MFLPTSGSHLNRSEANSAQQARQDLVRMENTQCSDVKMLLTQWHLWGYFWGEKKSVRAFTFSCSASSFESLNIRPFSLCFTSSCKLWKKVTEGKKNEAKSSSGTFPVLHSEIQRDQTRISVSLWPQMSELHTDIMELNSFKQLKTFFCFLCQTKSTTTVPKGPHSVFVPLIWTSIKNQGNDLL